MNPTDFVYKVVQNRRVILELGEQINIEENMNVKRLTEESLESIRSNCNTSQERNELNEGIRAFLSDNYSVETVTDDEIKKYAKTIMSVDEFPEKELEQWAQENGWIKD